MPGDHSLRHYLSHCPEMSELLLPLFVRCNALELHGGDLVLYHPWTIFCTPCGIVSDRPTNVGDHSEPKKMCKLCKSLEGEKNVTKSVDPKMGSKLVEAFLPHSADTVNEFNVKWNKWQDACMEEYHKDDSDDDDVAKGNDDRAPGFDKPSDVAALLRKGKLRMICPFNDELLEYLPMILELNKPLKDQCGPPLIVVVRPSTRFLCVCGTVSSSLKAVQAHTENCKLTKNLAAVVKETKAVSQGFDKKKCFLKCKGMDPEMWKNQVDVFNNMMMIEYIQQAGWHLQCHPNSTVPIVQIRKMDDEPDIKFGLVVQDDTLFDDHERSECMGYQTEHRRRRNRVRRGRSDGRGVARQLPTYFNGYSFSGELQIKGPSSFDGSPSCIKNFKNRQLANLLVAPSGGETDESLESGNILQLLNANGNDAGTSNVAALGNKGSGTASSQKSSGSGSKTNLQVGRQGKKDKCEEVSQTRRANTNVAAQNIAALCGKDAGTDLVDTDDQDEETHQDDDLTMDSEPTKGGNKRKKDNDSSKNRKKKKGNK